MEARGSSLHFQPLLLTACLWGEGSVGETWHLWKREVAGAECMGCRRAKGLGRSLGSHGRDLVTSVLLNYTCGHPGWYDLGEETVKHRKRAPVTGTPALSPPLGPPSVSSEVGWTRCCHWLTLRCLSSRPEPGVWWSWPCFSALSLPLTGLHPHDGARPSPRSCVCESGPCSPCPAGCQTLF